MKPTANSTHGCGSRSSPEVPACPSLPFSVARSLALSAGSRLLDPLYLFNAQSFAFTPERTTSPEDRVGARGTAVAWVAYRHSVHDATLPLNPLLIGFCLQLDHHGGRRPTQCAPQVLISHARA